MWIRCSIDVAEDLETVKGFSFEVHDGFDIVEIQTTTVEPDISPFDALSVVLADLRRRYGSQLELSFF